MTGAGRFKKGGAAKFRKVTSQIAKEFGKTKPDRKKIAKLAAGSERFFKKKK